MSGAQVDLERFRLSSPEPLSFRERGATVPFTTPILLNARIRATDIGHSREMVVANPSGGRGAFVLPWSAMPEICAPTLFDRHLWDNLSNAEDISPIGIRQEAQQLASQGLAGRHAATAAREAQLRDKAAQRLTRSILLEGLIASTETPEEKANAAKAVEASARTNRHERALMRASVIAEVPFAEFATDLEALAVAWSGATPEISGEESRLRQMLGGLGRMADGIENWVNEENETGPLNLAAHFIYQSARQTMECAEKALSATNKMIVDFGRLLPHWKTEKEKVLEHARMPDWVMDGWRTPLVLWETTGTAERRAAIWELAVIAPVLPREAKAWLGKTSDWRETPTRVTQTVQEKTDWRSGIQMNMVARNENLLGSAISFENRVLPMRLSGRLDTALRIRDRTTTKRAREATRIKEEALSPEDIGSIAGTVQQTGSSGMLQALGVVGDVLAAAPDKKLLKIVSLVDRIANAEIHQRLLGPSLPRLRLLQPPRPASLKRLLLLPLSGALTNEADWRQTGAKIPRSAINPLMEALSSALGMEADAIRRQLRGLMLEEPDVVDRFGRRLWLLAAEASPGLPRLGASLSQAGLSEQDFQTIVGLAGGIWRHAGPLCDALQEIGQGCRPDVLRSALIGPAEEDRRLFAAALATLMLRAPHPAIFAPLLKDKSIPNAAVVEDMLNKWVADACLELAQADFEAGARLAAQTLVVLEELEAVPRRQSSLAATDLVAHRRHLDQFCRLTYREIVSVHITQGLLNLQEDELDQLGDIEAMARAARSLEDTGQRVATSQIYVTVKDEFHSRMERVLQSSAPPSVSATDVARVEDILMEQKAIKASRGSEGGQGLKRR